MADIFEQMDSLFRNKTPDGSVSVFMVHRFVSSDPAFAPFAKELSRIWDNEMATEIWRGALPRSRGAPRFRYPAPKKITTTKTIKRMAEVEWMSYLEAERAVAMLEKMGLADEVEAHYGIEKKKETA